MWSFWAVLLITTDLHKMGQMFHFSSYVANELQKPPAALRAIIDSLNTMSASLFAPVRCWTFCPTIFNIYQFLLSLAPYCSLSYSHTRWTNFFSVMYTHKPSGENINLRSATLNCYYLLFLSAALQHVCEPGQLWRFSSGNPLLQS